MIETGLGLDRVWIVIKNERLENATTKKERENRKIENLENSNWLMQIKLGK